VCLLGVDFGTAVESFERNLRLPFTPPLVAVSVLHMLKRTLSSAIRVLFTGWNHDWTTASVDTFKWRFDGMRWLVTKHIKLSNASNPSKRNMCIKTCVDCGLLLNWVLLPQLESFRCPHLRIFLPVPFFLKASTEGGFPT
jgi:hypothetical protein